MLIIINNYYYKNINNYYHYNKINSIPGWKNFSFLEILGTF